MWIAELDGGKLGFWTSSGSGKAKRLAHTERVTLQPSNAQGKVKDGSTAVVATAELLASGPAFDAVTAAIVAKYGFMTKITKLLGTVGGIVKRNRIPYGDRAVVITLSS